MCPKAGVGAAGGARRGWARRWGVVGGWWSQVRRAACAQAVCKKWRGAMYQLPTMLAAMLTHSPSTDTLK